MNKNEQKRLEEAQRKFERHKNRKCDWDDPRDVVAYRREKARQRRMMILDRHVKDRVCPSCKAKILEPSRWAVIQYEDGELHVICRSCQYAAKLRKDHIPMPDDTWFVDEYRVIIDYRYIIARRNGLKLTAKEVAKLAGWSKQRQSKIESGNVQTLSLTASGKLFNALGMQVPDANVIPRFTATKHFKQTRKACGVSLTRFSKLCGWSITRQRELESGKISFDLITRNTLAGKLKAVMKKCR